VFFSKSSLIFPLGDGNGIRATSHDPGLVRMEVRVQNTIVKFVLSIDQLREITDRFADD